MVIICALLSLSVHKPSLNGLKLRHQRFQLVPVANDPGHALGLNDLSDFQRLPGVHSSCSVWALKFHGHQGSIDAKQVVRNTWTMA
jgi:hypothetical protein